MAERKIKIPSQVREGVKTALKPLGNLEDRVKELVEKIQNQKIKPDDLAKVLKELQGRLKKSRTELERSFNEGVAQVLGTLNLATKADLNALEKKVEKLAKAMAKEHPKKKAPAKKKAAKKPAKKTKK